MCLQKHPYATLLLLCQVISILYNQKMELMEIDFLIMQKPFSLASSPDQLSVHCIFNHFICFYYLWNYIYVIHEVIRFADKSYTIIHLAELSKRLKIRASQMSTCGFFFYLIKYVHYYKELEVNNVKKIFFIILKLENVEIVSVI